MRIDFARLHEIGITVDNEFSLMEFVNNKLYWLKTHNKSYTKEHEYLTDMLYEISRCFEPENELSAENEFFLKGKAELSELISELKKEGVFEIKDKAEFDEKIVSLQHRAQVLDEVRGAECGLNEDESIFDIDYKHIATTIHFDKLYGARISSYFNYWADDTEEPYEFNGKWFDEQF